MKEVLKLENVWKIYRTGEVEVNALKEFTISIEEGEYLSVLGPSGSGKSTFLHIAKHLPQATVINKASILSEEKSSRIGIWEDTDLEESHRHHAHLSAIYPFDTIDWENPEWKEIVSNTIDQWIGEGMGLWSGWSLPWASIIHTRLGNGNGAKLMLDIWKRVFTNEGYGTLHDCNMMGLTLMGLKNLLNNQKDSIFIYSLINLIKVVLFNPECNSKK